MKIVFSNEGLLDIRGLKTFGMSAKDGKNPIGYFGTGLKYAIAVILREGGEITVKVGPREYLFHKQKTSMRGKEFSLVRMNQEELAFTTELGKNWGMPEAFRELYCNAWDEGGNTCPEHIATKHTDTRTTITVNHVDMERAYYNRDNTILNSKPIYAADTVEFHVGRDNSRVFYRGIHASNLSQLPLFTYNLVAPCELTEDRTLKSPGNIETTVVEALCRCTNRDIIRTCLTAPKDTFEHQFTFFKFWPPSVEFMEVARELRVNKTLNLNQSLFNYLAAHGEKVNQEKAKLSAAEEIVLERSISFAKRLGYEVDAFPIIVVEHLGENILGLAKDNRIFIAKRNFMSGGAKMITATLIEEFIHLRHGYEDCSRGFQNFILEAMVSLGEEVLGETL